MGKPLMLLLFTVVMALSFAALIFIYGAITQHPTGPYSPCRLAGMNSSEAVCGADGRTYADACWAQYQGRTTVAHSGPCAANGTAE